MSLSNKELLDKIKDDVAIADGWIDWAHVPPSHTKDDFWDIVCERYATEKAKECPNYLYTRSEVESCIKDSLQAAAENAKIKRNCEADHKASGMILALTRQNFIEVSKESITDPNNIRIL